MYICILVVVEAAKRKQAELSFTMLSNLFDLGLLNIENLLDQA